MTQKGAPGLNGGYLSIPSLLDEFCRCAPSTKSPTLKAFKGGFIANLLISEKFFFFLNQGANDKKATGKEMRVGGLHYNLGLGGESLLRMRGSWLQICRDRVY